MDKTRTGRPILSLSMRAGLLLMVGWLACEYVDTVTVHESTLTDSSDYDAYSKRARYFVLVPGDVARNAGVVACTVFSRDGSYPPPSEYIYHRPDTAADSTVSLVSDTLSDTLDATLDTLGDSLIVRTTVIGDTTRETRVALFDTCSVAGGVARLIGRMCIKYDSVYYTTLTLEPVSMEISGALRTVYPQRVYHGPTRDTTGRYVLTRYFEQGDTNVRLHAFEDRSGHIREIPDGTIVVPNYIKLGDTWRTPPMVWNPDYYADLPVSIHGQALADTLLASTADSGAVEIRPYLIGTKQYYYGLIVKRYYAVSGTYSSDAGPTGMRGSIAIDDYYFKDAGLCKQRTRRLLRISPRDGCGLELRETVRIDRGDLQARVYPD
jgi:hypothetical protein